MPDNEVVAQRVELGGGDARLDVGGDEVQGFRSQTAGPAHRHEIVRAVNLECSGVAEGSACCVEIDHEA